MVKINTFSMAVSKTYCLLHFQTEICFFHIFFFHMVNVWPSKNAYRLRICLSTSPMDIEYPKNMKELA